HLRGLEGHGPRRGSLPFRGWCSPSAHPAAPCSGRGHPCLRLPRDLGGIELAALLRRYGYEVTRQTGSHMRLTSRLKSTEHHVTIPRHEPLRVGTLSAILAD